MTHPAPYPWRFAIALAIAGTVLIAEGREPLATTPKVSTSDRLALSALYDSTDGPSWTVRTNWRNGDDSDFNDVGTECTWYGLICDGSSRIIEINLESNGLSGPLPPELGNLAFLSTLRLSWNQLAGSIPPELANLAKLSTLSAFSNLLSGSLPSEFGLMTNLNSLNLSFNNLTGPIPPEIGGMSSLWTLKLNSNFFTGEIPAEIANLSGLWTLDLSANNLSGPIPPEFGNMSGLRNLSLYSNQLNGSLPAELAMLTSLQNLDLGYNNLAGQIPSEIWGLDDLKTLDLSSNGFVGTLPVELRHFSGIYLLDLSWNNFEGTIPAEFGEMSKLKYLSLEVNRLSGSIPPELGQLGVLEILRLDRNELEGAIPPELGDLSALKSLSLYSNHLSGNLPRELGDLSSLQYINIRSNRISGVIPQEFTQLTNLWDSSGLRFSWNALQAETPETKTFVDLKHGQFDGYWLDTQTLPPVAISVDSIHDHTVWLSWDPVENLADPGGTEAFSAPVAGPWASADWTWDKSVTTFPVTGLEVDTAYECAVASYTDPHDDNSNLVMSELGPSEMFVTASTGCEAPVIEKSPGATPTLSIDPSFDTIEWSTGETTASIVVAPPSARWYWVRVTGPGGCDEAATVFVDPNHIFGDGFESGDTSRWAMTRPGG